MLTYDDNQKATKAHCRLAFSAQPQRFFLPLLVGLRGSTDTIWRKSSIEENIFWKITLPSTLFLSAEDVCTINLTVSFYLYLYLKPAREVFHFQTVAVHGLRDRDIIFRDETDLVFCFLGCVVTFPAREANSWRRRASVNPGSWVCVFFSFFFPSYRFSFFLRSNAHTHINKEDAKTRGKVERRQKAARIT